MENRVYGCVAEGEGEAPLRFYIIKAPNSIETDVVIWRDDMRRNMKIEVVFESTPNEIREALKRIVAESVKETGPTAQQGR